MVKNYSAFTQVGATANVFLNHSFKNERKKKLHDNILFLHCSSVSETHNFQCDL